MQRSSRLYLPAVNKWKPARVFRWCWVSIVLLGILSNTLVNFVLDLKYQRPPLSMSVEEYFNALIAAWLMLGGTRAISARLDRRLPWRQGPRKRLFSQMGLHLLYIVVIFNLVLVGFTYAMYGGFYNLGDILVIDICVVAMSFLFSAFDSSIAFFANWRKASTALTEEKPHTEKPIEVALGKVRYMVNVPDLQYAYSEGGLTYLQTSEKKLVYGQSLDGLMEQLGDDFFRANRQVILRRNMVRNYNSLPQGKIQVQYGNDQERSLTVSRTKAAAFRQWLKA